MKVTDKGQVTIPPKMRKRHGLLPRHEVEFVDQPDGVLVVKAVKLTRGSRVADIYGATKISERHRHRYEVNTGYKGRLEQRGMRFSGMSPDGILPEIIEYEDHPWFIGVQFHPELKSRPFEPHPLFSSFIGAAVEQSRLV